MQMLDKNYNKLEIGDKVLLFGMIGTVYQDTNALGLFFEEGIQWTRFYREIQSLAFVQQIRMANQRQRCSNIIKEDVCYYWEAQSFCESRVTRRKN